MDWCHRDLNEGWLRSGSQLGGDEEERDRRAEKGRVRNKKVRDTGVRRHTRYHACRVVVLLLCGVCSGGQDPRLVLCRKAPKGSLQYGIPRGIMWRSKNIVYMQ